MRMFCILLLKNHQQIFLPINLHFNFLLSIFDTSKRSQIRKLLITFTPTEKLEIAK